MVEAIGLNIEVSEIEKQNITKRENWNRRRKYKSKIYVKKGSRVEIRRMGGENIIWRELGKKME